MRPRETQDPWGRRVLLTSGRWLHVIDGHAEMVALIEDVLRAVRRPDVITPDRQRGRWRYWRAGVGPSRWLFVVEWDSPAPHVVTAYGKRKDPL